jgi:DNA-binding MltR family transcriptional regulator
LPPDVGTIAAELPGVAIVSWEEDMHATYSFNDASPSMVAKAVDRLFEAFFSPGDYSVKCKIKNLG